jgi:hypothetical protein
MKKSLLLLVCIIIVTSSYCQNPGRKIATKYMRPSITTLFFQPKNAQEELLITNFRNMEVSSKFNDHKIVFSDLNCNTGDLNVKKQIINDYVKKSTNPIMAKWWNRNVNGDFNYDYVAKMGLYTSTDADAVMSKGSVIDRREMMGEELIGKTYILLYEITGLYTMEQKYDQQDAVNQKHGITKPVSRTYEGYEVNYNVYAFQLCYDDSVSLDFYNNYWTDVNNHNVNKVKRWPSAVFPVRLIKTFGGSVQSTQLKDLSSSAKKKSMTEMLKELPQLMQEQVLFSLTQDVEDLNLKATIFKTKPLSAKMGTKESLYLDQRFFVYEIEADQFGNQEKKLKGVVRAKTIAENKTVATGESEPSIFTQQGGKKLYEGMFITSNEDVGAIFDAGFFTSSSDKSFGGLNLGLEYRISRVIKKRGIYVGIDFSVNYMNDLNMGKVYTSDGTELSDGYSTFKGFTYSFSGKVSKEMYFTKRGNVYLDPSVGLGIVNYSFNSSNNNIYDFTVDDAHGKSKHNPHYLWSSYFIPLSLGLGFFIKPSMSVEIKPVFRMKFAATTGDNLSLNQNGYWDSNWGFDKIDRISFDKSVLLNFRYRF